MGWAAHLDLRYTMRGPRAVAHHAHTGPLRILQSLYPEGDGVCHNVLVHPPGGLVGGDTLDIAVHAAAGTHGLITTPGATRFYRSAGPAAVQRSRVQMHDQARLERLPLETLCYNDCRAENHLTLALAPGAEFLGWDVTALGLPQAGLPFLQGSLLQHIEAPGVWLERGALQATDTRLMEGATGLAGMQCIASLFFVTGTPLQRQRRQQALDAARDVIASHPLRHTSGATSPNGLVIIVRCLAPLVEPAMLLLREIRNVWRQELWNMSAVSPRIWSM